MELIRNWATSPDIWSVIYYIKMWMIALYYNKKQMWNARNTNSNSVTVETSKGHTKLLKGHRMKHDHIWELLCSWIETLYFKHYLFKD